MARSIVLGRSGTGKSWFSGWLLQDILRGSLEGHHVFGECDCDDDGCGHTPGDDGFVVAASADSVASPDGEDDTFRYAVHIDPEDEERGFSDPDDPVLLTYTATSDNIARYVKFREQPEYIPDDEWAEGPEVLLPKWVFYRNRYVRVVPDGLTDGELKVLVEMFADAAMKAGDTHFSLDEAHLVATKHNIGSKLMRLATGGRKRGVEWLFITQRPQKMHEDLLSQSDYTIYFELRDRDRDKAAEKSEAIEDAEDTIESLGKRRAIIEDFDRGVYHEFSTEDLEREIPHVAGDDGRANRTYEGLIEDGDGDADTGEATADE